MWTDPSFSTLKFIDTRLPFCEDFSDNYKVNPNTGSNKLFNLMKKPMLKGLFMARAQPKNHIQTINELKFQLSMVKGNIDWGEEIVRTLFKEKEDLISVLKLTAVEA